LKLDTTLSCLDIRGKHLNVDMQTYMRWSCLCKSAYNVFLSMTSASIANLCLIDFT